MRAYTASALLLSILCLQTWVRSCCGVSLHGTSLSLLSSKKNRSKKSASSRRKSSKLSAPNPAVEEEEVIAADDFADESGELVVEGESGTADGTDNSSGGEVVSNEEEEGKGKMAGLQIAFSVFSLLANHLVSKLNFKDKTILRICRLTLVVYLVVSQLLVMLLKTMIKAENDTSLVEEPSRDGGVSQLLNLAKDHVPGMDLLKGMLPESLNSGDNSGNKASKRTVRDYDLAQADKLSIGLITEAVITLYLDLIAKMSYMLLIIPLSGITGKINNPLVQVHFFKKKAVGALARPFKSAFEAAMARSQQQVEEVKDEEGGEEPNIPALAEEVVEVVDAVEKVVDEEEEEEEALASGEREEGEEDSEVVGDPEEESLESTTEESVEEPAPAAELTESWPSLSDMAADTDISAGYSGEEEYLQEEQPYDETTHYDGSNSGEVEVDYDHEFSASEFSEIEDGGEQEIGQDEH